MRIKNIEIKNFLSFDNAKLDLANSYNDLPTIYLINGINYDNTEDDDASNGSGKSAIIGESVFYSLFGKSLRGSKQKVKLNDMVKYGTDFMENKVEFLVNNDGEESTLSIERKKVFDGASKTSIKIDGEEKTKRTKSLSDKDIKMFIDLTPEVFSQVVVYYKDNLNLLSMSYSQRLDFFKNLINLDIIDEYYLKFKNFKNINDKMLDRLKLNYKNTKEIIDIVSNNKDDYIEHLYKKIKEFELELIEVESAQSINIKIYEEKKEELTNQLSDSNDQFNEHRNVLSNINSDISKIEKEIKKFKTLSGVICPTCRQNVTNEYSNSVVDIYKKELEENNKRLIEVNKTIEVLKIKIDELNTEIKDNNQIISNVRTENLIKEQNIKKLNSEIRKYKEEIDNYNSKPAETVDKSKYERRLEGIAKAIVIRETWAEAANYWYTIFAPKSNLRSTIIRKYINILSDMFEYYISKLYNNEILGKIMIDEDGQIDIFLYQDNFETNYWQMSSGEKKRIDVAIILSLYEFTSYLNENMPKFLILDEIFDSLDQQGVVNVMSTLLDVQNRHDIDLFIISHIPVPIEIIPEDVIIKNILVTKKDRNSSVKHIS